MKRTNEERTMEKNTDKRITCARGRLIRVLISLYPDQREWLAGQGSVAASVRAAIDAQIKREEGK